MNANNRFMPTTRGNGPASNLKGQLLIATPLLRETNFEKTVVLIVQDDEQGIFGIVLNRPATEPLLQAWRQISGDEQTELDHFSLGGPLGGPIYAVHPIESLGEVPMQDGVFLTASAEVIDKVIQSGNERFRIFFGIAGWQPQQLTQELSRGLWHLMPGDSNLVFEDPTFLWERSLLSFGRTTMRSVVGPSFRISSDPTRN